MKLTPIHRDEANAFVRKFHRHHQPPLGYKFALGCAAGSQLVGVIIVGRPVARCFDDGKTLEVTRCCTDGTRNACSFLYGAAWRAARSLAYERLITYTLAEEGGASLRGAGWRLIGKTKGGQWDTPARPRVERPDHLAGQKVLWEAAA